MPKHRNPQGRVSNDVHPDNPTSTAEPPPGPVERPNPSGAANEAGSDPGSPEPFNPVDGLESLHLEVVQLEALVNATCEAVLQLSFPSDREERRAFERVYALATKTADEAGAVVTYGNELIAALAVYLKGRRAPR